MLRSLVGSEMCIRDSPISKPDTYDIDGFKAMMLPWICDENYQETLAAIEKSDAKMAFSHLELNGFELYPGMFQQGGIDKGIIAKFPTVFSGHYHTRSNDGQVFYLGNPYEMYWNCLLYTSDAADE